MVVVSTPTLLWRVRSVSFHTAVTNYLTPQSLQNIMLVGNMDSMSVSHNERQSTKLSSSSPIRLCRFTHLHIPVRLFSLLFSQMLLLSRSDHFVESSCSLQAYPRPKNPQRRSFISFRMLPQIPTRPRHLDLLLGQRIQTRGTSTRRTSIRPLS